jgi:hypothetical protein
MTTEKVKRDKELADGTKKIRKAEAEKAKKANAEAKAEKKLERELSKSYQAALEKGAKAEAALTVVIPKVTRPIQEILKDRVIVLDGHIGLKLADDTPIEENFAVLDHVTGMSDHVGFMIGDVLLAGESNKVG